MKPGRVILKDYLVFRGLVDSPQRAEALLMAGEVLVNGQPVRNGGQVVPEGAVVELRSHRKPFVSRGAFKLEAALDAWKIVVHNRVCADVGSSTGGFTDLLLKRGALKVFAIDVGYGELDWSLRKDARVVVMERTNARNVEALSDPIAFACIDVSFISLRLILPAVTKWFGAGGEKEIVALVKPQFEAAREDVPRGGVIIDPETHREVLQRVCTQDLPPDLFPHGIVPSPIKGGEGNQEYLLLLRGVPSPTFDLNSEIERAFRQPIC